MKEDYYLLLRDEKTGDEMARFAVGYGLASCHVKDGVFYAFASRFEENNWNDVTLFKSIDLKTWEQKVIVKQENEHLFNSSVCEGPRRVRAGLRIERPYLSRIHDQVRSVRRS